MAKIIVKFGYMKPSKKNRDSFVEYIAKRDGVIKNIHSFGQKPSTTKQNQLIKRIIKKFPKMIEHELYQEYQQKKTIYSASEFITTIEEKSLQELSNIDEYVQYIAQRPRVVKEGSHGLFSIQDSPLVLKHVKESIKNHPGNIWTVIVSLKREDATRLGYDNLNLWKSFVRSQQNVLAKHLKIDSKNFEWYAAFHDESHHPHLHLVMFAKDGKQGYLNKQSMNKIRSAFAREIFKDEHLHIYKKQTHYRDQLKLASKENVHERIDALNQNIKNIPRIDSLLIELNKELLILSGKHTYGYLPKPLKRLVDEIVNEVSVTPHVRGLFDLWYEQRNEILSTYTSKPEQIRHLADIDEFKSIKNMVIKSAKEINISIIKPKEVVISPHSTDSTNAVDFIDANNSQLEIEIQLSKQKDNSKNSDESKKTENSKINISASFRLLFQISNLFETSMLKRVQNYQVDQKILLKIRKQKIALGQLIND